jgi:hypothetical protein
MSKANASCLAVREPRGCCFPSIAVSVPGVQPFVGSSEIKERFDGVETIG